MGKLGESGRTGEIESKEYWIFHRLLARPSLISSSVTERPLLSCYRHIIQKSVIHTPRKRCSNGNPKRGCFCYWSPATYTTHELTSPTQFSAQL